MADLIFLAVIALFAFYGMKKGFLGSLLGMASVLLSMLLGAFLYKPVSMLILESGAGDSVREAAKAFLAGGTGRRCRGRGFRRNERCRGEAGGQCSQLCRRFGRYQAYYHGAFIGHKSCGASAGYKAGK